MRGSGFLGNTAIAVPTAALAMGAAVLAVLQTLPSPADQPGSGTGTTVTCYKLKSTTCCKIGSAPGSQGVCNGVACPTEQITDGQVNQAVEGGNKTEFVAAGANSITCTKTYYVCEIPPGESVPVCTEKTFNFSCHNDQLAGDNCPDGTPQ